jgi:ABC-type antimicrobial peptide transport system permease subunit
VHGGLSIQRIQTLQSYADNHAEEFLGGVGLILSALAGIAATLSMIGVYGLLAQLARQRRQEIGVRRALGCSRVGAARLIVGNGLRIASLGGFMGLCAGAALAWIMQGFLYDWDSVGLAPVLVVGIGIIGLAIVASWIPGKLAASVDPLVAIRGE